MVDSVTTWVEAGWETLQTRDDHLPLVAHLQLQRHLQEGAFRTPPARTL